MRPAVLLCASLLVTASCTDRSTAPDTDAACRPVVRFAGVSYEATTLPEPPVVRGVPFGRVTRTVPCEDRPDARPAALADGESTFLPATTGLHGIVGHPREERIAVRPEDRWIVLVALPD